MTVDLKNNRIYHFDENKNLKEHKAFSTNFSQIEILTDGRILIMEDYFKYTNNQKSNLYCLNQNIEIEWFLPTDTIEEDIDVYVGFSSNDNIILANSWNGFRVEIDIKTGEIISKLFTK